MALLQACRQNDAKEIASEAKNCSQSIAKLISSLKGGVLALRDCDEASKSILEAGEELNKPEGSTSKSYAQVQRELTVCAKEMVAGEFSYVILPSH